MFLRQKKLHEAEVKKIKKSIKGNFQKASESVKKSKDSIKTNNITIEMKNAFGSHHA